MNQPRDEPTITDSVSEGLSISPRSVANVKRKDLVYRFIAGALTSIVAGALTLALGPRAGGIMLAFPAILAASLTLIEEQEDSVDAREDARGAVVGGAGLAVFAAIGALTFGTIGGALSLALAAVGWVIAALGLYFVLWGRRAG
jgi:Protein of unknown function (DUF3147)